MLENKFTDILYNQITFFLALIGVIWGIFIYLSSPTIEIALIKQNIDFIKQNVGNELLHLSDNYNILSKNYSEQYKEINELNKKMERILVILEEKK